ncbi:MAG: GAF domain-containing protein [Candidatus Latescibacteria bacterium]|nr:GAF domain-containing protein [Candidatus Latescibacterota bacterium]
MDYLLKELETRLRYEEALSSCSKALLTAADTEKAIPAALSELLKASKVSRVYIFENFYDPEDGLCCRQIFETCAPGIKAEIDNPELKHIPYTLISRWRESLSLGNSIEGEVATFPRSERDILEPQGILSILVLPIFTGEKWYGFIGFDDTKNTHIWQYEDIRLLQTSAEMIGSYIERMKIEDIIQFERAELLSIFDSITEIIYVADPYTYEILYVNKTLMDALGENPKGKTCYREFQKRDTPCDFCTNAIILKNKGKPYQWEYHNTFLNADFIVVDRIISWPDGRYVRFEFATDITERKKVERALRNSEKFKGALEMAGAACHELNQPLQVITGYSQLLTCENSLDPQQKEMIEEIKTHIKRLAKITKKLNNITRYETAEYVNGRKIIDINKAAYK